MNRTTEKRLLATIRKCNEYTNMLGDLVDAGRKNSAAYERAVAAHDKLYDLVCGSEEAWDWAEDPLYELGAVIYQYKQGVAAS